MSSFPNRAIFIDPGPRSRHVGVLNIDYSTSMIIKKIEQNVKPT